MECALYGILIPEGPAALNLRSLIKKKKKKNFFSACLSLQCGYLIVFHFSYFIYY